MFDISSNGIITVSRGDSFSLPLFINQGNDLNPIRYSMKDNTNCTIYLAITEPNQPFENALIKKVYTKDDVNDNGDVIIKIKSEDTTCLLPGKYYYQIKAKLTTNTVGEYEVNTIIPMTEFFIEE